MYSFLKQDILNYENFKTEKKNTKNVTQVLRVSVKWQALSPDGVP